ncbi:hydroxymethylbilane synthase [uncultured Vagococcus sp.]|uniref:hydroxymethylbilane synthase n=1 Tax=uncultured Vagococcus sp. TaxID=189676 RepID=UPI0028D035CC|nr:hydroxymethylbilane synthase [uncultured Vagococcus sp.]
MRKPVRVGTRNSPLAMIQTKMVVEALAKETPDCQFDLVLIGTKGDRDKVTPLSQLGTQGIFTDELGLAILENQIDFAVHSLKDMPLKRREDLIVASLPKREDPFDSLLMRKAKTIDELPIGAIVGTSSLRREVELLRLRPDLTPVSIRGNIDQRLEQLAQGEFDAIILANAGLNRLGWQNQQHFSMISFNQESFMPSAGQGALALECRKNDTVTQALLKSIADPNTVLSTSIEQIVMQEIGELSQDQTCGAYAMVTEEEKILLTVMFADPANSVYLRKVLTGDDLTIGKTAAMELIQEWQKKVLFYSL